MPNQRRTHRQSAGAGQAAEPPEHDAVSLALRLLVKEVRRRLHRHPAAHLLAEERDSIDLSLPLPIRERPGWLTEARAATSAAIDAGVRRLLVHRRVFRPGSVYCLRCASAECEHATPDRCGQVFAGYTPSGLPRFLDLGQWLLERQEPRVDLLYRSPPGLVVHLCPGEELTRQLLPVYRDADSGYHIHGQVTAGWYRFPDAQGLLHSVALSFQIVSSRPQQGRRRFGLNLLGLGPGDEPLENLLDRVEDIPWLEVARWAQRILGQIERASARHGTSEAQLERRLVGLLSELARRLQRHRRAHDRRTPHGRKRHREPARPTWKALADLAQAGDDQVLLDARRDTLVVLGERGRAHVFNRAGRLVTSIRYSPAAIERRRQRGHWRPAGAELAAELRRQVSAQRRVAEPSD